MPLEAGSSSAVRSRNIATEIKAGKDPKQAEAIAYAKARGDEDTPQPVRAAGVMLLNGGNALFLKRSHTGDHPGEWCVPGGRIEDGESPLEAAMRELFEETGIAPEGVPTLHARRISTGIVGDELNVSMPSVDFTTFVLNVKEQFTPVLNDEHTGYAWAPVDSPPQPIHPDMAVPLAKLRMNELDVAEAIRDGQLTSPQHFMNVALFDMRITGTGLAYRSQHKEYVWRDPALYLNARFVARCNGLQVILEHPKGATLNSQEFTDRSVGAICLPYIKGDEVWGIAKIYDATAIEMMEEKQLSTSPTVVFGPADGNTQHEIDGKQILIEGSPKLLDHVAICFHGVWDKQGDPNGIVSIRGDSIVAEDKKVEDKKADEAGIVPDKMLKFMDDMGSFMDSMGKKMDSVCSRMDSFEEEKKADKAKADAARKDAEEKEEEKKKADAKKADAKDDPDQVAADKKKADAEEEEKKKADAEAEDKKKADAARSDAQIDARVEGLVKAALTKLAPRVVADDERRALSAAQAHADQVYHAFGDYAPRYLDGELVRDYEVRLLRKLQPHSKSFAKTDLALIADEATFKAISDSIYADAAAAARSPVDLPLGTLRSTTKKDAVGREITTFHGRPSSWMGQFSGPKQMIEDINAKRLN